jgi:hypothetical protein
MKRLSTALAPTLMTGALLGISAVSYAQSNILGWVGPAPDLVKKGDTFSLIGTLTRPDAEAGAKSTTIQSNFRFDPTKFQVTTTNLALPQGVARSFTSENVIRTFSVASGAYQGVNTIVSTAYGIVDNNTDPPSGGFALPQGFQYIRYDIRVLDNATGGFADIGYSNAVITSPTLAASNRSLYFTTERSTTTFQGTNSLGRAGAFRVGIVPGPSSLAVFAMGGLAPAMALLRRRRAAK